MLEVIQHIWGKLGQELGLLIPLHVLTFSFDLLCLLYLTLTVASAIPKPNSPLAGSPAWFQSPTSALQLIYFYFFFPSPLPQPQICQEPQTVSEESLEDN